MDHNVVKQPARNFIHVTIGELSEWISSANLITIDNEDYDRGHNWCRKIYEKNGEYFGINFFDNRPLPILHHDSQITFGNPANKEYVIIPLVKHTRMIEETYFDLEV
jgi:hypothetical protein